jgi:uncharacterized protein YutE (UPF0331/DUF86 family)
MRPEFGGIESRLKRLDESWQRLEALRLLKLDDFLADADLRAIAERTLEVAAQCCIDIAHRILSAEGADGPSEGRESLLRLGEIGVLPVDLARRFAPVAGFRNILVHGYLELDWERVYQHLPGSRRLRTLRRGRARVAWPPLGLTAPRP